MRSRAARLAAAAAGVLAALVIILIIASRQITLLVLDVPERRETLVVKRIPALGMRLIESEASLCNRQGPGSALFSLSLPVAFCPLALAKGPLTSGSRVLLSLPFSKLLHDWAG